jgi:hypothetical protein
MSRLGGFLGYLGGFATCFQIDFFILTFVFWLISGFFLLI